MVVSQKEEEVTPAVIDACRQGDREAFRVLYEAYSDKVYSMALYFFHGDRAMANDVTQHVFLKLIINIRQFRGESGFSTWLYRFVVNACVDRTQALFREGRRVCDGVGGRLTLELRLTWLGGRRILERVHAGRTELFRHRPTLGAADFPLLLWRAARWRRMAG